jgi:hypothetical protein
VTRQVSTRRTKVLGLLALALLCSSAVAAAWFLMGERRGFSVLPINQWGMRSGQIWYGGAISGWFIGKYRIQGPFRFEQYDQPKLQHIPSYMRISYD